MPKKIPTLGAVAADEKKKGKIASALSALGAALGLAVETKPSAKMSKRTETTKHTIVEEEDTDHGKEEEEEEEMDSASDMSSTDKSDADTESSAAEEEEEEEEASAEEGKRAKGAKYEEEEEEKALTRAVAAAFKSSKVKAAFLAEIPAPLRPLAALRSPERLFREMKRATGARSIDDAMMALSRLRAKAAGADEKILAKHASLEAKVAKIETDSRKERVERLVATAKGEMRAGATTKEGRAMLREYGMEHGSKKLEAFIAAQPKVARTVEKGAFVPRAGTEGEVIGGMGGEEDKILAGLTAGMSPEAKAAFEADYKKRLSGAAAARAPRS